MKSKELKSSQIVGLLLLGLYISQLFIPYSPVAVGVISYTVAGLNLLIVLVFIVMLAALEVASPKDLKLKEPSVAFKDSKKLGNWVLTATWIGTSIALQFYGIAALQITVAILVPVLKSVYNKKFIEKTQNIE